MKYGMRERVSGIIILAALAVIFLPMLFSAPAPRGEGPEPILTVEQPIDLPQNSVSSPASPLSGGSDEQNERRASERQGSPMTQSSQLIPSQRAQEPPRTAQGTPGAATAQKPASQPPARSSSANGSSGANKSAAPDEDPIMAAAMRGSSSPRTASAPSSSQGGDWAVQAGSFGEAGNADRLVAQLKEQGFAAYKQPRGSLNIVFVGPFSSSEQGEQARAQLQQKANIKGLVVRRKDNE